MKKDKDKNKNEEGQEETRNTETNKEKPFKIPQSLLSQLEEFSGGGYILFSLNDYGVPDVYTSFDGPPQACWLIKFAQKWTQTIDNLNDSNIVESIKMSTNIEEEEEEDEEHYEGNM